MTADKRPGIISHADLSGRALDGLLGEIYLEQGSDGAAIDRELRVARRNRNWKRIGAIVGVSGLLLCYGVAASLRRKPAEEVDFDSLSAAQQAVVRSLGLDNRNVIDLTKTCAAEMRAKAATLDQQRALGAVVPDEPDADEYRASADAAEVAGIPCASGTGTNEYWFMTELEDGRRILVNFNDRTLAGDNDVRGLCPTLDSLQDRAALAAPGSELSTALHGLVAAAIAYCNPASPNPNAG